MITYKSVPDRNKSCPVPSLISFYLKIMIKVKLVIESLFMSCHWPKYDESLSVFNGTTLHHLRFLFFPSVVLSTPREVVDSVVMKTSTAAGCGEFSSPILHDNIPHIRNGGF